MTANLSAVALGTPFQQGFRAAESGSNRNPYQKGTYEHANWYFGNCIWHDGVDINALMLQYEEQPRPLAKIYQLRADPAHLSL